MGFYDAFKDVLDVVQKADNIDLYRKLLELSKDALDLQNDVLELSAENRELKNKIMKLEEAEDLERDLELLSQGYYIRISEREQGKTIRYCTACWQNNKKLMPYTKSMVGSWICNNCHYVMN